MSISYSSKFRAISMCTVQACECTQTHTHTYTTSTLGCHHTWRTTALESHYSQLSSAQPLSRVRLFATPWTAARQASLSITISGSSPKLMSIESVMPSNHLILSSPSPALNLSQHQGVFEGVISSHLVAKVLEFQLQRQSFQ